jgi:hypothetical protein
MRHTVIALQDWPPTGRAGQLPGPDNTAGASLAKRELEVMCLIDVVQQLLGTIELFDHRSSLHMVE